MATSHSLVLGQSYLPLQIDSIDKFISEAAGAIERYPDVAAEISIAATHRLLKNIKAPPELNRALTSLIRQSCKARDQSVQ